MDTQKPGRFHANFARDGTGRKMRTTQSRASSANDAAAAQRTQRSARRSGRSASIRLCTQHQSYYSPLIDTGCSIPDLAERDKHLFQLLDIVAQPAQARRIAPPVFAHLDPDVEINWPPQQALDLVARRRTDLFEHLAVLAD